MLFYKMKKKLFKLLLLIVLLWRGIDGEVHAQNLVKNPSFENYIQCPVGFGLFNGYVKDWFGFTGTNTSSYFHSCAPLPNSVPQNIFGNQNAFSGNAYACINVFSWSFDPNHRSYVEGNFQSVLKKDSIYCITYYVSLCDFSLGAIKNIDAHLSDTLLDWNNGIYYLILNISPQIKSNQLLNDSIGWIKVNGLYKAHGGEQYITIGNFLPDAQTTVISFQPGNPIRIDYYIDDVSVTPTGLLAPNLGNDTLICKNTLPYLLTAPVGYDSYQWSNGSTGNSIAASDSGTYWVKCILAGCGEISDAMHIGFKNTPQLKLGNDTVLCVGNSLNIVAQGGFNSYLWNTTTTSQSVTVNTSGLYIVQATDACGIQTDSIHVSLDSLPNITIDIGIDSTICNNGVNVPLILSANTVLPNYFWSTGDSASQITVTKKGLYWLQSYYQCGIIYDSILIDECPPDTFFSLYIPNSFTPNSDGMNDSWQPYYYNITIESVSIFNRWGEKVFEGKENSSWNGTYNNKLCPQGVYAYTLKYKGTNGNILQKTGVIALIR